MPEETNEQTSEQATGTATPETSEATETPAESEPAPEPESEPAAAPAPTPSTEKPHIVVAIENHLAHLKQAIADLKKTTAADFPETVVAKTIAKLENAANALGSDLLSVQIDVPTER